MAFIQPCFIRKNTPELRKKLEELGYKPFGSVKYEWDTGWGLSTDNRLGEFESFDKNGLDNIIKCESPDYEDSIDCGTNEELFIALAALRDDSDYMQWFTDGEKWFQNKQNDIEVIRYGASNPINFHKATVEEIIEHFKKE
jgi:hypothetical protein